MKNWSIKQKLMSLIIFPTIIILIAGGMQLYSEYQLTKEVEKLTHSYLPAVKDMGMIDMMHDGLRGLSFNALYLVTSNKFSNTDKAAIASELKEMIKTMRETLDEVEKLDLDSKTLESVKLAKPNVENYISAVEMVVGLSVTGNQKQAEAGVEEVNKRFEILEVQLGNLSEQIETTSQTGAKSAEEITAKTEKIGLAITFFGIAITLFLGFIISKDLLNSLTENIDRLQKSSNEVASASQDSSNSATQLSEAATEQAASLQETMASVEEISAMVSQNSESAERASTSVKQNQQSTERGVKSVDEMLDSIDQIKNTNDEILTQMESSNREFSEIVRIISGIEEKTKVINDIVFQTKLLSFNASVEAARAGEHGKGFAVVAEEVGNLAQMSGTAAKEIGEMLATSINQVNQIVERTTSKVDKLVEMGKEKIKLGQTTASRCKDSLVEISNNASAIASMMSEIAHASKEQSQGISEINKAISQLDQVTHQNSSVAHQSSSQAERLNEEAQSLELTVKSLISVMYGGSKINSVTYENKKVSENKNKVIPIIKMKKVNIKESSKTHSKIASGSDIVPDGQDPKFEDF